MTSIETESDRTGEYIVNCVLPHASLEINLIVSNASFDFSNYPSFKDHRAIVTYSIHNNGSRSLIINNLFFRNGCALKPMRRKEGRMTVLHNL